MSLPTDQSQRLLAVLINYAPNASAQALVSARFNEMHAVEPDPKEVEKQLVSVIYDGVHYGNWIWDSRIFPASLSLLLPTEKG